MDEGTQVATPTSDDELLVEIDPVELVKEHPEHPRGDIGPHIVVTSTSRR